MRIMKLMALMAALALVAVACGDSGGETTTTAAAQATTTAAQATTTAAPATTEAEGPPVAPSSVSASDQTSDGAAVVVDSVSLPAAGFIAVHSDADGKPGPVIGHTELLPAGESTDVTVTLDEPLAESATVWPMAHIDINENDEYEFSPPDVTIDGPGLTDSGDVAMVPIEITVG